MRIIFFFENVHNIMQISKMQRKIKKKSFVSEIIVSELVVLNCPYKEENTSHRQSLSYQIVLRIFRALTQIFFRLNYVHRDDQIWQRRRCADFNNLWALLPCFFFKRRLKRDFTDIYPVTFFGDGNLRNTSAMRIILFLKMLKIQCRFSKCREKLRKSVLFLR